MKHTNAIFRLFSLTVVFAGLLIFCFGCKKNTIHTTNNPRLVFKFYFDSTQVRLNNFGQPATMPAGHAGISPIFNLMSSHYIELALDSLTQLGGGTVVFKAAETTAGGANAIVFDSAKFAAQGQEFFSLPLSSVTKGTYTWLRVSLAYQNYSIPMNLNYPPYVTNQTITGTVASFVGFNTYLNSYKIKDSTVTVNANEAQGYWGFETQYASVGIVKTGQAQVTTVPNPISASSPIPTGSCVVTGRFANAVTITGTETQDIVINVKLSTNKSFEFVDVNGNGLFDVTGNGAEQIVDMGIRGMIPEVQ